MKRAFMIIPILVGLFLFPITMFSQTSVEQKEAAIQSCLDDKAGPDNWRWLIDYFESYLEAGDFGTKDNIAGAYKNYIEYRTGYPSKKMPPLANRQELKKKLIDWKIISNERTLSPLFFQCYYEPNRDFETYPKGVLKDIASIGDVLSQMDLSSGILMGGLGEALKEKDLQKEIYKRSVILLSIGEVLYIEEVIKGEAGEDNPIFRSLKQRAEERPADMGVVPEGDPRLERKPEPEGGIDKYLQWINDNNHKKASAKSLGKSYRVIVEGIVNKEGTLTDVYVIRGLGMGYDEEAVRLVRTHPVRKWKTGTIGGKPVNVAVYIEVDFRTGSR